MNFEELMRRKQGSDKLTSRRAREQEKILINQKLIVPQKTITEVTRTVSGEGRLSTTSEVVTTRKENYKGYESPKLRLLKRSRLF